jgi:hypothetical protein
MTERVSVIPGQGNVLLVVPHGSDDSWTSVIAEGCVAEMNCHAVINRGFERADHVDALNDKADCNKVSHVTEDVVYEEFLQPIKQIKERIVNRIVRSALQQGTIPSLPTIPSRALIFYIHGAGDIVHKKAGEQVSIIVGNGGDFVNSSLTCEMWRRDLFIYLTDAEIGHLGKAYAADPRGNYAGRSNDNMNQFFRQHEPDKFVETMQLEIPHHLRVHRSDADKMGMILGRVISKLLVLTEFKQPITIKTI